MVLAWPARKNRAHNPFQALLSDALDRAGWSVREFTVPTALGRGADLWHWHWPDGHFSGSSAVRARINSAILRCLLLNARVRRIPVVWTAHNVRNHDGANADIEARFMRHFVRSIAGVHFLSEASRAEACAFYPDLSNVKAIVLPHGDYRATVAPQDRAAARSRLGVTAAGTVLAFVGKIRRYKGVSVLLDAFTALDADDAGLIVAGALGDDSGPMLEAASARDERVRLVLKHLDDSEIEQVISAADVVVLPYEAVTNSGSAILALSLDRPILVPDTPLFRELRAMVGADWVMCFTPPLTEGTLRDASRWSERVIGLSPRLDDLDWDGIAGRLAAWYGTLRD